MREALAPCYRKVKITTKCIIVGRPHYFACVYIASEANASAHCISVPSDQLGCRKSCPYDGGYLQCRKDSRSFRPRKDLRTYKLPATRFYFGHTFRATWAIPCYFHSVSEIMHVCISTDILFIHAMVHTCIFSFIRMYNFFCACTHI